MRFPRRVVLLGAPFLFVAPAFVAADANWAAYLGDTGGTHYSTLTQITPANVAKLQPAWTFHAGGADPKNRSQVSVQTRS